MKAISEEEAESSSETDEKKEDCILESVVCEPVIGYIDMNVSITDISAPISEKTPPKQAEPEMDKDE